VHYGAGENTLYEIDSNKKLRTREGGIESGAKSAYASEDNSNTSSNEQKTIQKDSDIADIIVEPKQTSDEPNMIQKTWRWMTQIF
jgi:hypothetical protein